MKHIILFLVSLIIVPCTFADWIYVGSAKAFVPLPYDIGDDWRRSAILAVDKHKEHLTNVPMTLPTTTHDLYLKDHAMQEIIDVTYYYEPQFTQEKAYRLYIFVFPSIPTLETYWSKTHGEMLRSQDLPASTPALNFEADQQHCTAFKFRNIYVLVASKHDPNVVKDISEHVFKNITSKK